MGGDDFFLEREDDLVKLIPPEDVEAADVDEGGVAEPPSSLTSALAEFIIGAADGERRLEIEDDGPPHRSMLIHPSRLTLPQTQFAAWVRATFGNWRDSLEELELESVSHLRNAYHDLRSTLDNVPPMAELKPWVRRVLAAVAVREINASAPDERPNWNRYAWVLVGGQLLDRGYTVKGLTVTYMPRGIGVGNADSIQQRARFYGYKRGYLDYCRLWLAAETRDALANYVRSERALREHMKEIEETGSSLRDWRRQFLLSSELRPTRQTVIRQRIDRFQGGRWYQQLHLFPDWTELQRRWDENETIVSGIWADGTSDDFHLSFDHPHRTRVIALEVLLGWIVDYSTADRDREWFSALQLQLEEYSQERTCRIFLMGAGEVRQRRLSTDRSSSIQNLHQGRSGDYPGDRAVHEPERLSLQIHNVTVTDSSGEDLLFECAPAVAVRAPEQWASVIQGMEQ